jgi:Na+-driven multidrug efflux pump
MDKLIELKSTRVGFAIAGVGFVAALLALILNYSPAVMLNVLFISFCAGSILEGFTQLYYYRRGIRHA